MATNLDLDDSLIEAAVTAGGHRTKREAVNAALSEYIRYLKRKAAIEAMGREEPGDVEASPPRTQFDHALGRRAVKASPLATGHGRRQGKRRSA